MLHTELTQSSVRASPETRKPGDTSPVSKGGTGAWFTPPQLITRSGKPSSVPHDCRLVHMHPTIICTCPHMPAHTCACHTQNGIIPLPLLCDTLPPAPWFDLQHRGWQVRINIVVVRQGLRCRNYHDILHSGDRRAELKSSCRSLSEVAPEHGMRCRWGQLHPPSVSLWQVAPGAAEIRGHRHASIAVHTSIILQLWRLSLGGNQGVSGALFLCGGSRGEEVCEVFLLTELFQIPELFSVCQQALASQGPQTLLPLFAIKTL